MSHFPEEPLQLSSSDGFGYFPAYPGLVLNDQYTVTRKLGYGPRSSVWMVVSSQNYGYFAVKILTAHYTNLAPSQEISALKVARQNEYINFYGSFTATSSHGLHLCLVLDVAGPSLEYLRNASPTASLSTPVVQRAVACVVENMKKLHKCGIIHGAIMTGNIATEVDTSRESLDEDLSELPPCTIEQMVVLNGLQYPVVRSCPIPNWIRWNDTQADVNRNSVNMINLGHETPYKLGYASIVILGAMRLVTPRYNPDMMHAETLQYLVAKKLPVDIPDIAGWTALSHAVSASRPCPFLTQALLGGGANVNNTSRFGDVPLIGAMMRNNVKQVDLLMSHGADLDIPDGDNFTPRDFLIKAGPEVTAVVQRHIAKREGREEAPLVEKSCDTCRKKHVSLRQCSKCHVARYCSLECQRDAWSVHKTTCRSFSGGNTLTFKPSYMDNSLIGIYSNSHLARSTLPGPPEIVSERQTRSAHVPKEVTRGKAKNLVIKVQVAMEGNSMLVYDKKRDFVCQLSEEDGPENYHKLDKLIRKKGVFGLKGYFSAELKSRDELIIKVSELLAEQPF